MHMLGLRVVPRWFAGGLLLAMCSVHANAAEGAEDGGPAPAIRLKQDLLLTYDKWKSPDDQTDVTVSLFIKHVTLSEMQSTMAVHAWVRMAWIDAKLSWRASEYGGLNSLHMDAREVWHPDLALKNSVNGRADNWEASSSPLLVRQNSSVVWVPTALFEVFCDMDLRYWPFDTQRCDILLGSWSLPNTVLNLVTDDRIGHETGQGGTFALHSVDTVRELSRNTEDGAYYAQLRYILNLQRQPGSFRALVIAPAIVVIMLCLATFWLPPRAGEKILLGGVNAVLICIFLVYFAKCMPVIAGQTPLIVMFYTTSLYLVCISLVLSVVELNLTRDPNPRELPAVIKSILTGTLGRMLFLSGYVDQAGGSLNVRCSELQEAHLVDDFHDEELPSPSRSSASTVQATAKARAGCVREDWLLFAAALDRISFLIYVIVFAIIVCVFHL